MIPAVCFVGKSGSGKTTLILKVLKELKDKGYRIGIVKHHSHHSHFDVEGKDTYRYYMEGADEVIISSPDGVGVYRHVEEERTLDQLVAMYEDVDIVIIEGYKRSNYPKIELVRKERSDEMICSEDEVLCLVTDCEIELEKAVFGLNSYEEISNFLIDNILK